MNRKQSIAKLYRLVADQRLVEARNLSLDLTYAFPQDDTLWLMRGDLHFKLEEWESVIDCCQRIIKRLSPAVSLSPTLINVYRVLGTAYHKAGNMTDAINAFERLIAAAPNDADAHVCVGISRLLLGDLQRGWPEYEWRLKTKYFMNEPPTGMPRWDGQPLNGKTILVNTEQGHGDTVQFVRYLRDINVRGGIVILNCQQALHNLLAGCAGVDRVVNQGDLAPRYDVETTLLSLPGIFRTSLDTIPADVPYLRVPQGAGVQAVAMIVRQTGVLRVGLVWAGGMHNPNDRPRSLKLEQFKDLFGIAGTKLFSLQKGEPAAELKSIPSDIITDLGPYLGDFADTAAAIQELDLVVSVDTAVAHVAGALARPVWTLIPFAPDWRWMLNREDSPWYPTMRLFRQPALGDWSSVIARVAAQLTELVQQQSATGKDRNDRSNCHFGASARK
jgi:hypothetical protein